MSALFIRQENLDSTVKCLICLENYTKGEDWRGHVYKKADVENPASSHSFHKACLSDWFKRKWTCPTCIEEVKLPKRVTLLECLGYRRTPFEYEPTYQTDIAKTVAIALAAFFALFLLWWII